MPRPLYSSPGLKGVHSDIYMGSPEKDSLVSLPVITNSLPCVRALSSPHTVLSRLGDCHQLREVGLQASSNGSISRNAGGHHHREGVSIRLLDYQRCSL